MELELEEEPEDVFNDPIQAVVEAEAGTGSRMKVDIGGSKVWPRKKPSIDDTPHQVNWLKSSLALFMRCDALSCLSKWMNSRERLGLRQLGLHIVLLLVPWVYHLSSGGSNMRKTLKQSVEIGDLLILLLSPSIP